MRRAVDETLELWREESSYGTWRLGRLEGGKLWNGGNGCTDMVSEVCDAYWLTASGTLDRGQNLGNTLRGSGGYELGH